MADILATAGKAVSLTKDLVTLSKTIENAELQHAIANLTLELADLKLQLAELITENADLKQQMNAKADAEELTFRDGLYYRTDDEHPFCPGCYDADRRTVRLTKQGAFGSTFGTFKCPSCDEFFD